MTQTHPTHPALAAALDARGYDTLTPVQRDVSDPALSQRDLLVSAQTGSGKTVGFGLALAPTLLGEDAAFGRAAAPLALVIAPTRELALQVKREFDWLYAGAGAVVASCVGGMDMRAEKRSLERGAHIVVATPGRLRDHIQRGSLDMGDIRAVVLDEADEMLDLGFAEDLEFILAQAPQERRTLMFSATVPPGIAHLAKNFQKDAARVTTVSATSQHADIEYRAMMVANHDVENAIINVLRFYEAQNALVFANTRAAVNRLTARFSNRGFSVVALSGELSQTERAHALQAMRDGRARVCVATDVAARGIDLPNLELVVHAELPSNAETLLHRSGRTGRAGRKGVSVLIVSPKTRAKASRLLKFAKLTAEWGAPPSADEVRARDEERLLADPVWSQPVTEEEQDFVARLGDTYAPQQVAAAYLRLFRERHSAPEDLAPVTDTKRDTRSFGPARWFAISVGRDQNAEPRWLLPMLCRAGNLSKDDIGAIRIQQGESFVEILESSVPKFLGAVGPAMTLEDGARLRQLDGAPDLGPAGARPRPVGGGARPGKPPRRPRDAAPAPSAAPAAKPAQPSPAAPVAAYEPDTGAPAGVDLPKSREEKRKTGPARGPARDKPSGDAPRARPTTDAPRADKPRHKSKGAFTRDAGARPEHGERKDRKDYKDRGERKESNDRKDRGERSERSAPRGKPFVRGDAPTDRPARKPAAANASVRLGPGGKPLPAGKGKPRGGGASKTGAHPGGKGKPRPPQPAGPRPTGGVRVSRGANAKPKRPK